MSSATADKLAANVHPIVDLATAVLIQGTSEPVTINDKGRSLLVQGMAAFSGEALEDALYDLVAFACTLDSEKKSPKAADLILELVEVALKQSGLQLVTSTHEDGVDRARVNKFASAQSFKIDKTDGAPSRTESLLVLGGMAARMRA